MHEWWKTNPIWDSDEHEFCEWLIKKEPDFFKKYFPFIGYVQILTEFHFVSNSQKLKSMKVAYSWRVGGLQSILEDQSKVRKTTEDKWFFVGKSD